MCPFSAGADVSRNVCFSVKFFEKTSFFWGKNPFLVNCEPVMTFLANVHKVTFGEPYKAPFKRLIWSLSIDRKKKHSSIGTLDLICHLKQLCIQLRLLFGLVRYFNFTNMFTPPQRKRDKNRVFFALHTHFFKIDRPSFCESIFTFYVT